LKGSPRWSEVTAFFGGTFDPPHLGHRLAVDGLFAEPGVKAVRVLPSPLPPHKPTMAPTEARVEMARLAFAGSAAHPLRGPVSLDLSELDRAASLPAGAPTYTFDTLSLLKRDFAQLAFVIGTDQLQKIHTWHRFPDLLGLSHWIVLERKTGEPGSRSERSASSPELGRRMLAQLEGSGLLVSESGGYRVSKGGTFIQVFRTEAPALSSTEIRESLAKTGAPPDGSILPEVHAYLMKHRFYGTRSAK
jgi:nicotinate (nicotinamide) nucleotide adenylyltransferase